MCWLCKLLPVHGQNPPLALNKPQLRETLLPHGDLSSTIMLRASSGLK